MRLGKHSLRPARPRKLRIVSLPCLRHESSLTPLLVLYKFKAGALNLRGERKERIGSFPGSFGNRGSGLERVSFDDARHILQEKPENVKCVLCSCGRLHYCRNREQANNCIDLVLLFPYNGLGFLTGVYGRESCTFHIFRSSRRMPDPNTGKRGILP